MITNVSVMNWRSHEDTKINFDRGTNLLVGKMGSGKSSIMNAICFGLFGTFPDLQTRKIKLDDVIMDKPRVEDESQITVKFNSNGKEYTVMRVIERGKGTVYSEIREGETLIESPSTQGVTEVVCEKLKIDYDTFSRVIYSEQNGIDYFLKLPRGERMKRIDNLLMIDRFENARANLVRLHNKVMDRKTEKQNVISKFNHGEMKETLTDVEYSIKNLNKTILNLNEELEEKLKKKLSVEKKLRVFEDEEKKLNELLQQKKTMEGTLDEIGSSIKSIKSETKGINYDKNKVKSVEIRDRIQKTKNLLVSKRKKFNELNTDFSTARTELSHLSSQIKTIQEEISEKEKLLKEKMDLEISITKNPEKKISEQREKLSSLIKSVSHKISKKNQYEKTLSQIMKLDGKCPTCQSEITQEKKEELIELYNNGIKTFKKEVAKLEKEKMASEKMVEEIEIKMQKWRTVSEKTSDIVSKKKEFDKKSKLLEKEKSLLPKLEKNLARISDDLKKNEIELDKLNSEKNKIEILDQKLKELVEKEKRSDELKKRILDVEKQISSLSVKVEKSEIDKLRKEFQSLISRESELSSRVGSLGELIKEKEKRKSEIENEISLIEKEKSDVKNLEVILKDLKKFEAALKNTQVNLRGEFIHSVNDTMSEIWSDIYPYRDFVNSRLHIKDRDYILQLETTNGRWIDVDGIASGGERSIASLVLRIAFSIVLAPQIKMLVLDEPTANLDTRAIEDLSTTLRDRVDAILNQVFIVTHEKRLEDAVTGFMYTFDRNKTIDEPTKVELVN
jgi:exonuclease SbcC